MPSPPRARRWAIAVLVVAVICAAAYWWPKPPLPKVTGVDFGLDGTAASVFAPDKLLAFELTVEPTELARMQANARDEVVVPANLAVGDHEVGKVGLRYKGSSGTLYSVLDERWTETYFPKLSLKILFDRFDQQKRFCELRRLNLHSMIYDGSLLRDRLCYQVFREAGIPAPRCSHAMVFINGEYAGVFAMVEQVDDVFVQDRFGDAGDCILYKEAWPTILRAARYGEFEKVNASKRPHDCMAAFARELLDADESDLPRIVGKRTDLETLTRYLIVDQALKNWDGITGWTSHSATQTPWNHNYYWHVSAEDRLTLIPWDLDATLRHPGRRDDLSRWYELEPRESTGHKTPNKAFAWAPNRDPITRAVAMYAKDRYRKVFAELREGPLNLEHQLESVEAWSQQIRACVAHDPHLGNLWRWEWELRKLRSHLRAIDAWMASEPRSRD